MPNQYGSEKKTIGELLSMTSPPIVVPNFQRDFSWRPREVDTFWQDILSFSEQYQGDNIQDQEYFLGSVVLVNTGTRHLVLDGQQRLATSTILLAVVRDFLAEFNQDAGVRTAQKYISDFDDATGSNAYKLTLNRFDRDFFRTEIQEIRATDSTLPESTLASHGLIRRTRQFFERTFRDQYNELGGGRTAFDWTLRVRQVLTDHVSVVVVSSADEDNAATVFETLNDRGIGLSTPDLLRNLILRRVSDTALDEALEYWQDVLRVEDEASVEAFLRHYWLSHRGDVKTRSLYREIKRAMDNEDIDALDLSRDLSRTAQIYRDIAAGRDDEAEIQRQLEAVSLLGASSLMPAILSSYAVGETDDKSRLLQGLIALYVRHVVIGRLETSQLENVVFNVGRDLRKSKDFDDAIKRLADFAPDDAAFVERFKTAQVRRRATARYLLRELEHAKRITGEVSVERPDRVHVEHIYPLTPSSEKWPDHNAFINRLGNQTLLARGLNTAIKNSDFAVKKDHYAKSDLALTQELLAFSAWDKDAIDRRQAELADHAPVIWAFPEE